MAGGGKSFAVASRLGVEGDLGGLLRLKSLRDQDDAIERALRPQSMAQVAEGYKKMGKRYG